MNQSPNLPQKASVIDKKSLDGTKYLESLLEAATDLGLLEQSRQEDIMVQLLLVLKEQSEKYDKGSSSLPEQTAQALLAGELYTIGLALKQYELADDALFALAPDSLRNIFEHGIKLIESARLHALADYSRLLKCMPVIPCRAYNDTLRDGLSAFFDNYDTEFFTDNPVITCDYPVCAPLGKLTGIELISEYIKYNLYECEFLSCFEPELLNRFFTVTSPGFEECFDNLFTKAYTAALICGLCGTNPLYLSASAEQLRDFCSRLEFTDDKELYSQAFNAAQAVLAAAELADEYACVYVLENLPLILGIIKRAAADGTLKSSVLKSPLEDAPQKLVYDYGVKTDNKRYRGILAQIASCDSTEQIVQTVASRVHSLSDFEDILCDAQLSREQMYALFASLQPTELAALINHFPSTDLFESNEHEQEAAVRLNLNKYVSSLPEPVKKSVNELAQRIKESGAY